MTQFVLVPGAWLGAWAWAPVTQRLEKEGHRAVPVTLTGMGERVHLLTKEVGMETAIHDVLNVLKYNELDDVVLVAHSFAGKVGAAVADRASGRVRKVVYLDAFRPDRTTEPQGGFDATKEFGAQPPGALGIPLTEKTIETIGKDVVGEVRTRFLRLSTPWPLKMAADPITLSSRYQSVPEAYVFCSLSGDPVDEIVAGKWGALNGPHTIVDTGHWPMVTQPDRLARDLITLAK